jgi:hypothetical protein
MSRIFAPKDGEVYGFPFVLGNNEFWSHVTKPLNNSIRSAASAHYKSEYNLINNCVLNRNPQSPDQILYDLIGMYFQKNLIGEIYNKISERTYLPLYYIKMDGYKQLLCKLKFHHFTHDTNEPATTTFLSMPTLSHTSYTDEYRYYKDNNQLNCSLLFKKTGFENMYDIENDTYPNLRVSKPILSEIIFFV